MKKRGAMDTIIFANCSILDGTSRERREDHHVVVEDAKIREVSDRPITGSTVEVIDLRGCTLMPGLIDAHVHVLAVDASLARLSDRPVTLLTLQAAKVLEGMLQRGFTTVRDPRAPMEGSPRRSRTALSALRASFPPAWR